MYQRIAMLPRPDYASRFSMYYNNYCYFNLFSTSNNYHNNCTSYTIDITKHDSGYPALIYCSFRTVSMNSIAAMLHVIVKR